MAWVFFGVGMALLLAGSGAVARGGAAILKALGLSPLLAGLLTVAFAMAAPELAIALQAVSANQPDIALGTLVGSNIVNVLLVTGLAAFLRPLPAPPKVVFRDGLFLLAASAVLAATASTGALDAPVGFALLGGFVLYTVVCFMTERRRVAPVSFAAAYAIPAQQSRAPSFAYNLFVLLFGAAVLLFGARYALDGAIALGRDGQVPSFIVALTLVAFGAALPELVATLRATAGGDNFFLSSQLLGSSIFNLLFVTGLIAVLHPLVVSALMAHIAIPVMAGAAALILPTMLSGWRIGRFEGLVLLAAFAAWLGYLGWTQGLLPHLG